MEKENKTLEKKEVVKSAKIKTTVPFGILAASKKVTQPLQDIANSLALIAQVQQANTTVMIALTKAIQENRIEV